MMVIGASVDRPLLRSTLRGLAVLGLAAVAASGPALASEEPPHSAELDAAIIRQAKRNGVPEKLVRRIVMRESKYNARARNHSFWGLMQISYPTAKSMGFKGTPDQLLNPFVNLTYAVPYLANAFVIAGKQEDAAVRLYASGYYATAKSRGLLGVLRTAETEPVHGLPGEPNVPNAGTVAALQTEPAPNYGIFGSLFGPAQQPRTTEQLVATAPDATAAPAAASPSPGSATKDADAVPMTAGKTGAMEPPRKWLKDGGLSTVARGEQSVEEVPAHVAADDTASGSRHTRGHAHKFATFAALDQTPATAQAYAGPTDANDARGAQSQAAITQMTSGRQNADASGRTEAAPPSTTVDNDPKPPRHVATRRSARKKTSVAAAGSTVVAKDATGESSGTAHKPVRHAGRKKADTILKADADGASLQSPVAPAAQ